MRERERTRSISETSDATPAAEGPRFKAEAPAADKSGDGGAGGIAVIKEEHVVTVPGQPNAAGGNDMSLADFVASPPPYIRHGSRSIFRGSFELSGSVNGPQSFENAGHFSKMDDVTKPDSAAGMEGGFVFGTSPKNPHF